VVNTIEFDGKFHSVRCVTMIGCSILWKSYEAKVMKKANDFIRKLEDWKDNWEKEREKETESKVELISWHVNGRLDVERDDDDDDGWNWGQRQWQTTRSVAMRRMRKEWFLWPKIRNYVTRTRVIYRIEKRLTKRKLMIVRREIELLCQVNINSNSISV